MMGGRTRAMVSDMLRQYFLNNLSLTVILPRSFGGTPARMMVKFRVDCCLLLWLPKQWKVEIPWLRWPVLRWPVLRGGWCVRLACPLSMYIEQL